MILFDKAKFDEVRITLKGQRHEPVLHDGVRNILINCFFILGAIILDIRRLSGRLNCIT